MNENNKPVAYFYTNSYAPPEQISVGSASRQYYHVESLFNSSFVVHVITSSESTISGQPLETVTSHKDIYIHPISVGTIKSNTLVSRAGYHVRFFLAGLWKTRKLKKADIVISSMPSILVGLQGYLISLFKRTKFFLDVRDLWTESLATTSFAKIPLFLFFNRILEKMLYKKADAICCTSEAQVNTVRKMVNNKKSVTFVPNGIDPEINQNITIHPFLKKIREQYQWIGLFAGKHSHYTDLDNLISAAKGLKVSNFALVLVGGGYTKKGLIQRVEKENIKNVFFHDPVPKSMVASFEKGTDIFFISYSKESAWAKVLPNKLFDYLYWNKPIISSVVAGEITHNIEMSQSGICVQPGKPEEIIEAVNQFINNPNFKINSRDYLLKNYSRKNTVADFAKAVKSCMIN